METKITEKPTTGRLLRFYRNGKVEVLEKDLSFPVLQEKKKAYMSQGILKKNLKITY